MNYVDKCQMRSIRLLYNKKHLARNSDLFFSLNCSKHSCVTSIIINILLDVFPYKLVKEIIMTE